MYISSSGLQVFFSQKSNKLRKRHPFSSHIVHYIPYIPLLPLRATIAQPELLYTEKILQKKKDIYYPNVNVVFT